MQARLKELGYFTGNVAGNYKDLTTAAVQRFQIAIGYNPDGIASSAMLEILYSVNAPFYNPDVSGYIELSKGSSGTAVYNLQQRLIALGWLSGGADGSFGDNTRNAVSAFQNAAGLTANGVADTLTQQYLYSVDAPMYTAPVVTPTPPAENVYTGYQALQPGDSGDLVKAMQARLKELGFFEGNIGGNYKQLTTEAVMRFQTAAGYPADGVASSALLELLYSDVAPHAQSAQPEPPIDQPTQPSQPEQPEPAQPVYLSQGSQGDEVVRLQRRLIELGWLTGEADGYYGNDTAAAVRAYQYQIAQAEDGSANVELQQRLYADDARAYVAYQPLEEGAQGDMVLAIQKRLIDLGYLDNTEANTDGEYGPKLTTAIAQMKTEMYQRGILLMTPEEINGSADIAFQNFLFSDHALALSLIPQVP